MRKSSFYTHLSLKKLVIILVCLSSNILFAEENIGEIVAEHIEENFESDVHASLQDRDPENQPSWLNNNLDYFFPTLRESSGYTALVQATNGLMSIPSGIAEVTSTRYQEYIFYTSSSKTKGNANNMQNNRTNSSSQTSGNDTNVQPVTIVMQDRNVAQMSGDNFIAAKIRRRKNVTHATINNDDNIRNVNLKLHSLYMSNIALSR